MDTRTKILALEAALAAAARLRSEGRALRVAAGGFDVLLAAHAEFLAGMRAGGAALLVAVFDDASLGRPVLPEQARAQLVAALRAVDFVVVWPAARLEELCEKLQVAPAELCPDPGRNIIWEVLERHR